MLTEGATHRSTGSSRRSTLTHRVALYGVLLLLAAAPGWGHRGHGVWTELDWVGDRFEITHRLHLADAIELLRLHYPGVVVDSLEGKARLALYVADRFQIDPVNGPGGDVETLGAEIEDDFLLVYQEWIVVKPTAVPRFSSTALLELDLGAQHFVRYVDGDRSEVLRLGAENAGSGGV